MNVNVIDWKKHIFDAVSGTLLGIILTLITYVVGIHFNWITEDPSQIEFWGVVFNYACVYLTARQSIVNWPLGIIAVIFLGLLFWDLKLYSSMTLNWVYFFPIQFYGWYSWLYGGKGKTERDVSFLSIKQWLKIIVLGIVSWIVISEINKYFGGASPMLDTSILMLSIVAQFLLTYKKLESWLFWIVVNVLSIYLYYNSGAQVVAFQYLLFLGNAFYGLGSWLISYWDKILFGKKKITIWPFYF